MTGLRWLRVSETKLMHVPDEFGKLKKLVSRPIHHKSLVGLLQVILKKSLPSQEAVG